MALKGWLVQGCRLVSGLKVARIWGSKGAGGVQGAGVSGSTSLKTA